MKLLFASDSFKGTLTSQQTVELLAKAAKAVFGEDIEYGGVPVADGGEGTTDAVVNAENGTWIETEVFGPMGEQVRARYGRLDDRRAVLEMAAASGLPLVPLGQRNPLRASSYGTGELIRHALDHGFAEIAIAIGGSATNDGGMGCAQEHWVYAFSTAKAVSLRVGARIWRRSAPSTFPSLIHVSKPPKSLLCAT